ncbi:glycerol kinase GlpK [Candidatus Bipolaricaulota bacterium]
MTRSKDPERTIVGAIDLGTTGVRFALYDRDAVCLASAYREIPIETPRPGWVEQDPDGMFAATLAVLGELLSRDTTYPDRLAALGIANQRETVIAWDRETGRPLYPAIVWQDKRTAERCTEVRQGSFAGTIVERTGLSIDPYFSATKIEWLLRQVPRLRERARDGDALLGTVDAWLLWQLTGEHMTDDTNASRTMLFDIDRRRWDDEVLGLFEIPRACLPEVRPSFSLFGAVQPELVPGAEVQVAGVLGDQQAALLGQGLTEPGEAQVTWGTGAFLLMNAGEVRARSESGLVSTIAYTTTDAPPCYALEGSIFVAGAAVQWLREIVGAPIDSEALAEIVDSSDGVVFVPALTGLGAPHWDPHARGLLVGLTRGTRREHLVRAALEAIAYQTHDVVRAMEHDVGEEITSLHVGGGAARNDFLCQFQSDILGVPVIRPQDSETTARGAAFAAGITTGLWDGLQAVRKLGRDDRQFEPTMSSGVRDRLLEDWRRAVERAKGWDAR